MLGTWFTPTLVVTPPWRAWALERLDILDKWSLLDCYIMGMMVAFSVDLPLGKRHYRRCHGGAPGGFQSLLAGYSREPRVRSRGHQFSSWVADRESTGYGHTGSATGT